MVGSAKRTTTALVGAVLALGSIAGLAACTAAAQQSQDAPTETTSADQIAWRDCDPAEITAPLTSAPQDLDHYQCATVQVPLNWDEPEDGRTIDLAVAKYSKAGQDAPPLFFNLGGPGGDAVRSLPSFVDQILPQDVSNAYQVIAVDPRGVGASTPIRCLTDEELDAQLAGQDYEVPEDPAQKAEFYRAEMAAFADQCIENSGDIVGFVDTNSVAHDLDHIRGLLGADKLDYVGYSYGTTLGAEYAQTFPAKVGRMVLDGALDPAVNADELVSLQANGMEQALYHWVEWCLEQQACPVGPDLDSAKRQFIEFFDDIRDSPLPTGDDQRPLTLSLAETGIVGALYNESSFELLRQGMSSALAGNGQILLLLADYYNGRNTDGTYSNSRDAFVVINSLESTPVGTLEDWVTRANQIAADNPVLGPRFGFTSAGLEGWPIESRSPRGPVDVSGTAPIVIIGTTNDPATPYVMAQSLAASIEDSVLLTVNGFTHGAYREGASPCLLDPVNAYLIEGVVPEPTTC